MRADCRGIKAGSIVWISGAGRSGTTWLRDMPCSVEGIGLSRMYLGVHYPTDVLAGYLAAPLWLVFIGSLHSRVDIGAWDEKDSE